MNASAPLLGAGLLAALAAALATSPARADAPPRRLVLVVLEGARPDDLGDGDRTPFVQGLARDGVTVRLASEASGPHAATTELLTGRPPPETWTPHDPPEHPTLAEYVRAGLRPGRDAVWFVSFEGGSGLAAACSRHPAYGPARGPRVAYGAGAFAEPLGPVLEAFGRPLPTSEATWSLLRDLRAGGRRGLAGRLPPEVDAGSPAVERAERALLAEIDRRAMLRSERLPRDERAIGAAATLLSIHGPVLLVLRLGDLAHAGEGEERAEALRLLDGSLARLHRVLEEDARPRRPFAFVLVAPQARGPRGEGLLVGAGDGLRRARRPLRAALADVAPTLARLLGTTAPEAQGAVAEGLLAGP